MQYSLRQNEPVHSVHSLEQTIITIYHNAKQFLLDLSFLRRKLYVFFDFLTVSKFIIHCKTYKRVRNILQNPWIYTHCFFTHGPDLNAKSVGPIAYPELLCCISPGFYVVLTTVFLLITGASFCLFSKFVELVLVYLIHENKLSLHCLQMSPWLSASYRREGTKSGPNHLMQTFNLLTPSLNVFYRSIHL